MSKQVTAIYHKTKRIKPPAAKLRYRSQVQKKIERLFIPLSAILEKQAQSLEHPLRTLVFLIARRCYRSEHLKVAKRERGA